MKCPVCGKDLAMLSPNHVKLHGYSGISEFLKDYPSMGNITFNYGHRYQPVSEVSLTTRTEKLFKKKGLLRNE